jgi:NitT/TauT family transport system permease protein
MKKPMITSIKRYGEKILVISFWLLLWEIISRHIGQSIILPSPVAVADTLIKLCVTTEFWEAILFSSLRIIGGFALSVLTGIALSVAAYNFKLVKLLITPLMKLAQAMPVASFIILALIWIKSRNLSVLTSFMMVMPLIYANIYQGLEVADEELLQMAKVFRISRWRKIKAIYIPAAMPHFVAAISVGVGLCWKAGIAAEVIGIPTGSMGQKLYEAKIYLLTKELFAWTAVIIAISIIFEKVVMQLVNLSRNKPSKGGIYEYSANKPDKAV